MQSHPGFIYKMGFLNVGLYLRKFRFWMQNWMFKQRKIVNERNGNSLILLDVIGGFCFA